MHVVKPSYLKECTDCLAGIASGASGGVSETGLESVVPSAMA